MTGRCGRAQRRSQRLERDAQLLQGQTEAGEDNGCLLLREDRLHQRGLPDAGPSGDHESAGPSLRGFEEGGAKGGQLRAPTHHVPLGTGRHAPSSHATACGRAGGEGLWAPI